MPGLSEAWSGGQWLPYETDPCFFYSLEGLRRAGKMAKSGKVLQAGLPSSVPWTPHDRRREPSHTSCSLISTCIHAVTHTHTYTHTHTKINKCPLAVCRCSECVNSPGHFRVICCMMGTVSEKQLMSAAPLTSGIGNKERI